MKLDYGDRNYKYGECNGRETADGDKHSGNA